MRNKIKILLAAIIIQGCSNGERKEIMSNSKTMLMTDTVPMKRIDVDIMTFESTVKKSLVNQDFNNISYYLDSTLIFSVKTGERVYRNQITKDKVIDAINTLLENSQLTSYTLYKTNSDNDSVFFYLLIMHVIVNETETDVNILFTMNRGTINSVQLY